MKFPFQRLTLSLLAFATAGCTGAVNLRQHYAQNPTAAALATPATRPAAGAAASVYVSGSPATLPVPLVTLAGTGAEMGTAHGRALGRTIAELHEQYLKKFLRTDDQLALAANAAKSFEVKLVPGHREEVAALAAAADLPETQVMLGQCFLDLVPMTACSTVALPAGASVDGVARFGRNLDFPSLGIADKYSTLFVQKPAGKNAFASVGWPGLIGVLSGMNEHGLTLANMEVTRLPRVPTAMPYMLLYRRVLEECKTVDDAIALLRKTPKQTANNLMLMDASGGRAVVELTPYSVTVRRAGDGQPLVSTNHQRGATDLDTPGRCRRFDYLRQTSADRFGTIDERAVEDMLAHVGARMTLQSMVFEPTNRVVYLSTGTSAAKGTFTRIDLKPMFAR